LKKEVDSLRAEIVKGKVLLARVDSLKEKSKEKLKKKEREDLVKSIEGIQKELASFLGMRARVTTLRDSLDILKDKARGETKKEVETLQGKVKEVFQKIGRYSKANKDLEKLKEDLKKKKEKPKPRRKAPPKEKIK
jgi:predicted RNase H-like nuclease (RuvC/YqgF family)